MEYIWAWLVCCLLSNCTKNDTAVREIQQTGQSLLNSEKNTELKPNCTVFDKENFVDNSKFVPVKIEPHSLPRLTPLRAPAPAQDKADKAGSAPSENQPLAPAPAQDAAQINEIFANPASISSVQTESADTDKSRLSMDIQTSPKKRDLRKNNRLKWSDSAQGLCAFRQWWERAEVELSVCGKTLFGVPIFVEGDTIRLINETSSYFVPLSKIDYIRTDDGL